MSTFNAGAIEAHLTLDRSSWVRDYRTTLREVERLEGKSITIGVDADTTNAEIALDNLERQMDTLENDPINIGADADFSRANAELDLLEEQMDRIDNRTVDIGADADITNAMIQLDNLETQMDVLENDPVNIQVDVDSAAARLQLAALDRQIEVRERDPIDLETYIDLVNAARDLEELDLLADRVADIDMDVDVHSAGAMAELATVEAAVKRMDGQDIDIDVDVRRGPLNWLEGMLASLAGNGGIGSGGGHMGLLRMAILALIALSPIVSVAFTSIAGGVLALAGGLVGAGGAAGILGVGLFGLIQRFKDAKKEGKPLTDQMQALDDALSSLKDTWDGFLDDISASGFDLMARSVEVLNVILPQLAEPFNEIADAVGGVVDEFGKWAKGPEFASFLDFFGDVGSDMLVSILHILGNIAVTLMNMFIGAEPLIRDFFGWLERVTGGWAEWSRTLEDSPGWHEFLDDVERYGPMVMDFLEAFWDALLNLGDALEPFAEPMLEGLTWFFRKVADMDTDQLTELISLFTGLWAAWKIGPALAGPLAAALGSVTWPILAIIAAVALVAVAMWDLWNESEKFRDTVIGVWEDIKGTVEPIIEDIKEWLEDHQEVVEETKQAWEDFKDTVEIIVEAIALQIEAMLALWSAVWDMWGQQILDIVGSALMAVLGIIRGILQVIRGVFQTFIGLFTGDWDLFRKGIGNIMRGIGKIIESSWNGIMGFMTGIISIIGDIFRRIFGGPYDWVRRQTGDLVGWIQRQWNNVIGFFQNLPGRVGRAVAGLWDGIGDAFRNVINDIIGWWNNLSFAVDIPDRIPGLPNSFSINTPNVPYLAEGAWIDEPTLAVVGEGSEPEIVTPESKMRDIVANYSQNIDYGRLAAAVAEALGEVLSRLGFRGGLSEEDLAAVLAGAGATIKVDATADEAGLVASVVNAVSFELRRLGFGGKGSV